MSAESSIFYYYSERLISWTDTIWPYFQIIQTSLPVVTLVITEYNHSQKNERKYTKGFDIAFVVYTGALRIFHAIAATGWVENSTTFPAFLKRKPAKPRQGWVPSIRSGS